MRAAVTVAAGIGVGALALAGSAAAHHNLPDLQVGEVGECGAVTISTSWTEDTHTVDNTKLVVQAAGEQHTAAIGEPIDVGPFEAAEVTVRHRVWGGGERDYDQPPLTDLDALLEHIADGGSPLDADAPGVAWHDLVVEGCEPEPTPGPTTEPTGEPTAEPSKPATEPKPGTGEGGGELPATSGLSTLGLLGGLGAALTAAGGAALWLGRRRRAVPLD